MNTIYMAINSARVGIYNEEIPSIKSPDHWVKCLTRSRKLF